MRKFSPVAEYAEVAVEYLCLRATAWTAPAVLRLKTCIAANERRGWTANKRQTANRCRGGDLEAGAATAAILELPYPT